MKKISTIAVVLSALTTATTAAQAKVFRMEELTCAEVAEINRSSEDGEANPAMETITNILSADLAWLDFRRTQTGKAQLPMAANQIAPLMIAQICQYHPELTVDKAVDIGFLGIVAAAEKKGE